MNKAIHMTEGQREILLQDLKEFSQNPLVSNEGVEEDYTTFIQRRVDALPQLRTILQDFINDHISLREFKLKSEVACREFPYWGFKGFSGQMQLNQYANNIEDHKKVSILRNALKVPNSENEASEKINSFANYLGNLKKEVDNPKSIPRTSQYYLLSYFWEIQEPGRWPIYYGSAYKVLTNIGFDLDSCATPGDEYVAFVKYMHEISELYVAKEVTAREYPFWFVELVFWSQFKKLSSSNITNPEEEKQRDQRNKEIPTSDELREWLPRIVEDLTDLAFNQDTNWSKLHELKPDRAFEKKLKYAFTLLGFEVRELGQGTGRQPDGIAISVGVDDGDYAIIYEAKARENKFSIGTSDREIYEYIQTKKEDLKRERIRKLCFVIVSSDFDVGVASLNLLREIYKKTGVHVTLLKASDLLFLIEFKLQNYELNHSHLLDLFWETGLITRDKIIDLLK